MDHSCQKSLVTSFLPLLWSRCIAAILESDVVEEKYILLLYIVLYKTLKLENTIATAKSRYELHVEIAEF